MGFVGKFDFFHYPRTFGGLHRAPLKCHLSLLQSHLLTLQAHLSTRPLHFVGLERHDLCLTTIDNNLSDERTKLQEPYDNQQGR